MSDLLFSILPMLNDYDQDKLAHYKQLGLNKIHYDVMDEFVNNYAFDERYVDSLKALGYEVNVHLMVNKIAKHILTYTKTKCDNISFHVEPLKDNKELITKYLAYIKNSNKKAGLAFKFNTDICEYLDQIKLVDYVTLMSVEPGAGGQEFSPLVYRNIAKLIKFFPNIEIEIDGGINLEKACELKGLVSKFVSGSYFYKLLDDEKKMMIETIKSFDSKNSSI
ncbi:ribulose-phosphate 3-epimerase [Mycoplasma sp. T363T]|uniref:Ribulose-phosphate 3-epimerase n=1 Tax=Mycoplasma bradburyae TaxID=2963128 RepID=A0ABT5GBE0_9MOLU|nr:ribulose-phosphate 3-epimerase [Mycoplasma bradburyae]MDC4163581.1 ribulose-phosphate 3-epimerase [Mycoplasma bradburyae]MDC4182178.1 ribulose-phosphate 3-epimerase [Mycoplasma bradburyae]UTS70004.1 ribulose-phosphate 3-epimerase [Mycoplasma bradburyae]